MQLQQLGFPNSAVAVGTRTSKDSDFELAIDVTRPVPKDLGKGVRFLHIPPPPPGREGGLAGFLRSMGAECDERDILGGDSGNLADDAIWDTLKRGTEAGAYHRNVGGPPCSTFSLARGRGRGPRDFFSQPA